MHTLWKYKKGTDLSKLDEFLLKIITIAAAAISVCVKLTNALKFIWFNEFLSIILLIVKLGLPKSSLVIAISLFGKHTIPNCDRALHVASFAANLTQKCWSGLLRLKA